MTPGALKPATERDYGAILLRAVVLANDPSRQAAEHLLAGMDGLEFGDNVAGSWVALIRTAEQMALDFLAGHRVVPARLRQAITFATGESPKVPAWRRRKDIFG